MSGFGVSRGAAGALLAAAWLALPVVSASSANAAIEPSLDVMMAGSALSLANTASVGCQQTAQVFLRNPDGSPVTHGTVDFFSHLNGMSGNIVGTVPVRDGAASIPWVPDRAGQHVVTAIYYDGQPDYQPVAGYASVYAIDLGGTCV